MFYLIHNVLIILVLLNVCIIFIKTSPTTTQSISGAILSSSSEENINNGSIYATTRRSSPPLTQTNNAASINSTRNRNTQLFSVLAAKRRQILQNRLHAHLTTITADIVETTTHLNQLLGRNLTRVYVDIRTIRNNPSLRRPNSPGIATNNNNNNSSTNTKQNLKISTTDTKNGGNVTTDLNNNSQKNVSRATNGTVPAYNNTNATHSGRSFPQNGTDTSLNVTGSSLNATDSAFNTNPYSFNINRTLNKNGTASENVSQLAQNSSKLFQNTIFLLGNNHNGGNGADHTSKTNLSTNRKSGITRSNFRNSIYNQNQAQLLSPKSAIIYKSNKNLDVKIIAANISPKRVTENITGTNENNIVETRQNDYIPLHATGKKRLPIDLEQIAIDTLGIAESKKSRLDDLVIDNEDSLQVEESNHGLFLLNFLRNATKSEGNSIENITELLTNKDILKSKVQNVTIKPSASSDTTNKQLPLNNEKLTQQNSTNKTLFMSESLYNHFRPLESNLPEDEIQPFISFGQKLVVSSSTIKPLNLNRNLKLYTQRQHSRFNPESLVNLRRNNVNPNQNDNSESSLMDLSVERQQNIANKVLNIRNSVPATRHSTNPVINYFRSANNNTNSAYNSTRSGTSYKGGPYNKTEPSNILSTQRRNNMDAKNISIKYDTVQNMSNASGSESSEGVANPRETFLKQRPRSYYTRNPSNRTYVTISKRINVPAINSNLKPLALSTNENMMLKRPPVTRNQTITSSNQTERSNANQTLETTSTLLPILTTEVVSTNVVTSVSIKGLDKQNSTVATTTTTEESKSSAENINTNKIIEPTTQTFRIIVEDIPQAITTPRPVENQASATSGTLLSTQRTTHTTFVLKPRSTSTPVQTSTTMTTLSSTITTDEDDPNEIFTSKVEIITLNSKTSPKPLRVTDNPRTITTTTAQNSKHVSDDKFETSIYTRPLVETSTYQIQAARNKSKPATPPLRPNKSNIPANDVPETIILRQNDSNNQLDENNLAAYIFAILGLLPLIIIVGFVIRNILNWRHFKDVFVDSEADILAENGPDKSMEKHHSASGISPVSRLSSSMMISSSITDTINSKWEFPRNKLRLKTLLGEGNFGQVWKAEADDLKDHDGLTRLVAVKTIKDGAGPKERDDLHRELFIMQKIGSHPNVVQLLGCCTEKEPYFLIMEYVMYGKLLTYLRDHRARRDYYNFSDDSATLTSRDLTVFAYCVARGMEYLSSKGIIHRDLAARNILVDHNKLCKISDFGLSRYSPTKEVKEPRQPKNALPVRWMATEALMFSLFTEKSDVWSFGILLWEIVTLGATPYANMSGREVMHCVCEGYRLERPSHCKPELYRVMARTWASDPNQRPTFADLRQELAELLENNSIDYSYVDLESFAADSNIYEITNLNSRGNYCTIQSRISEFECDI